MRRLFVLMLVCGLFAAPLSAQCVVGVNVPNGDPTAGTCNVIPFGQSATFSAGYTYVSVINSTFMDPVNPYVDDIAFAPCGTGNWTAPTMVIGIGHLPSPTPAAFAFPTFDATGAPINIGSFMDLTLIQSTFPATGALITGPLSWNVTADTWSPMGFSTAVGTGFTWDGINNVGIFVTYMSSVVTGWNGAFHRETDTRIYAAGYNAPTCITCNSAAALKVQLSVTQGAGLPAVPGWQCNQASSSLDINGAADPGPSGPMITDVGTGTTVTANLGGLVGMPFDIAFTSGPGVPVGSGGILTAGGQAINANITDPTFGVMFGLGFTNAFGAVGIPLTSPAPLSLSAQQIVLDPALADGFAMSHLNTLNYLACSIPENFDGLATGAGVAPIGWTNPVAGTTAWTVHTGGTGSVGTGPNGAFNGPNYVYCETSGTGQTATFTMETCPNASAGLNTLSFELSAIGAAIGTLNIYQGDGSGSFNPVPVFTQTGAEPGQAQGAVEWTNKAVPLISAGPLYQFRFEYIAAGTFTGDLGLDDIMLF